MPADQSWQISEPRKLDFDGPVEELHVRIVGGTVNVVGTGESTAHVEVSEMNGEPLTVRRQGGKLVVAYDDVPWKGFLKWLERRSWSRGATVSVSVPSRARVSVGVVGASAVVSGVSERTDIRGVFGDTTLVGLSGPVRAETVSGGVETQGLDGELRFKSVSGDLTVIDCGGPAVRADSVSGDMTLDLSPRSQGTDIGLTTVSGEVAIRLPRPADTRVKVSTTSGAVSCAFDELKVDGEWGAKQITGALGSGAGSLKATTVSGSIALLRRPPTETEPVSDAPADAPSLRKDV